MQRIFLIPLFVLLLMVAVPVLAQDNIPCNCETATSEDVRNLIPRFEVNHSRLVLVDWRTGETVRVLGEGLHGYRIRSWSPDCRYLAIAEGDWRVTDTVVYDVENNVRMGSVPDAAVEPHPLTWGPDGYLMVESRHGAVLWHVPSGRQSILTESFNVTRVRNFVQVIWDMPHNQVLVTLAMGGRAAFDLGTGAEISLTDEAQALLDAGEVDVESSDAAENSSIRADIRISESFTGNNYGIAVGDTIPLVAEITNRTAYELTGELTVVIDVPVYMEITKIRIDPAQDYTDITSVVNSVRADGEMRTATLHDLDRVLKVERVVNDTGKSMIRLTWVTTEGLPAFEGASLQIDFDVLSRQAGLFIINISAHLLSEVPDEESPVGEANDSSS